MKFKTIICFFIISLLLGSYFGGASTVKREKKSVNDRLNFSLAELPEWYISNYWVYNMCFDFNVNDGLTNSFSVDAEINNMYATVVGIKTLDDDLVYELLIDGWIEGDVSLFAAEIDIADFRGDFGGSAYICKDTLGIKKFSFVVDGEVYVPILQWRDLYFEMVMEFKPHFDFFDFPIILNEEPWDVHIDEASIDTHVDIDIPFGDHEFNSSMVFNDVMELNRTEVIDDIPAGTYDTLVIGGNWGYLSNLWYAPRAGYLVKVNEGISWDDGYIESIFDLELVKTNFDEGNNPPDKPDKPLGPINGETEIEYTYTTQATDPNQDDIFYIFYWGDGSTSEIGPYPSGASVSVSHIWYNKGMYSIVVKAKDSSGLESEWSDPLSISIIGDPFLTVNIFKINQLDEIDVGSNPELYYKVEAISKGVNSPPQKYHNTINGEYSNDKDDWNSSFFWQPDKDHKFIVGNRNVTVTIKLMDFDDRWEDPIFASDDLADVSGCIGGGVDNDVSFYRGAIYHGTYDMVDNKLFDYETGAADENKDYVYKQNGFYLTSGEYQPDNSEGQDENDAIVWFKLIDDYNIPEANAQVSNNNEKLRPNTEIQFIGTVSNGAPPYNWLWNFDDGSTSTDQNPKHIFEDSGTYNVKLTVKDKLEQKSEKYITVEIENENPILTNDKLKWTDDGSLNDIFTFSVHYIDADKDIPTKKCVVIDGQEITMQGSGSNADYALDLLGKDIGKGTHSYYFEFEDGYSGMARTQTKSFTISKVRSLTNEKLYFLNNLPINLKILNLILDLLIF